MTQRLILFLFFLFSQNVFCEITILQFCPENPTHLSSIHKDLNFLKTGSDSIRIQDGCGEVKTEPIREKLYTRYIQQKYPSVRVFSPQQAVKQDLCHIELSRIDQNSSDLKIAENRGTRLGLYAKDTKGKVSFVGRYSVLSGVKSEIEFDGESFQLTCIILKGGYNINLKSSSRDLKVDSQTFVKLNQPQVIARFTKSENQEDKSINIINNRVSNKEKNNVSRIVIKAGHKQVVP
ncbi:MAG: hypothetical protein CME62_01385 [Halobacteriovoraceae bacterium]|nr:hypothetical protein [Halobacteriovoraceae bacterium]|tara:strand:+ start:23224 stop:23928 length:705 start_codon:yes stop_codon:yes gene_type:complete